MMCPLLVILLAVILVLFIALALVSLKLYARTFVGLCKSSKHLVGKVVIVTGANCGLGYATALDLAERGARVIITTIDDTLGIEARDRLIAESGNKDVHYHFLDLSSFDSIKKFAEIILKTETQLNVLINNAGIICSPSRETKDGLDPVLQVNYFGPFLLTKLLLPLLKSSAPSRIVNVASTIYSKGKLKFDDLKMQRESFNFITVYSTSKLYIVISTIELARRLEGTGVTVNCLHPGMVGDTQMGRAYQPNTKLGRMYKWLISTAWLKRFIAHFIKTPREGAQTTIYLAVSPQVDGVSGCYFCDCRISNTIDMVQNKDIDDKFWKLSEEIEEKVRNRKLHSRAMNPGHLKNVKNLGN